ncbi:structural maintenance of chromosomes 4-like protein, partial [Tanacetum coccineum]
MARELSLVRVLGNAAKNDVELRNVLGDTIGNPDQMRRKVLHLYKVHSEPLCLFTNRLKIGYARRGETFTNPKQDPLLLLRSPFETSVLLVPIYGSNYMDHLPDVDLIFHRYLVMANTSMEYNPLYDADKGFNVMPSSFHDVGDVEFQDNWGRV